MRFSRHLRGIGFALSLGVSGLGSVTKPVEKVAPSPNQLNLLERENAMWRLVKVEEEVPANLKRLRAAGYSAQEVEAMRPSLIGMWETPFERNFGWLHEDTVEEIKEIDRKFVSQVRATRLYEATGIRAGGEKPVPVDQLNRLWRSAILKVLDYDEIAEFRVMNSAAARDESRRVEGLKLTDDERRTLFEWRKEYDLQRGPALPAAGGLSVWQREQQLDQWRRVRELLGDERFVVYLSRAHPGFAQMCQVLEGIGGINPSTELDLWWLRQKEGVARDREALMDRRDEMTAQMRTRAAGLMGEARLADYSRDADARWLVMPDRSRRPAQKAAGP